MWACYLPYAFVYYFAHPTYAKHSSIYPHFNARIWDMSSFLSIHILQSYLSKGHILDLNTLSCVGMDVLNCLMLTKPNLALSIRFLTAVMWSSFSLTYLPK